MVERSGSGAHGRWPWLAFAACGIAATALYAANVVPTLAFALVGGGTVLALFLGPRWHGARPHRPWQLLSYAGLCFTVGAVLRPLVSAAGVPTMLLADLFTVPGYLLMIGGLVSFLSARRGVDRHAVIDGLIVGVGATVASSLLLAVPAASIHGRPVAVSVLAGLYPLFDVVLVFLIVQLAFTTALRRPSFVLLMVSVAFMLAGDLAYAIIGLHGSLTGSRLLDLPFLLAFTMIGSASVHPSSADLGRVTASPVQEWSWPRLAVIGPALAVPAVLTVTMAGTSSVDRAVLAAGGALIVGLLLVRAVSAVQSHAAAERRYRHQATHDPLTGLPNRRMLAAAVERILASNPPAGSLIWMFFLDLDGFKNVNDSWGHSAGDRLIVDVGRRLRAAVPRTATVARVGGDEFVVVELGSRPDATRLAGQIMACLHEPMPVGNAEVVISASMGIAGAAPLAGSAVTAEALMRDADTALYRTKSRNPGTWTVFDDSMHREVRERTEIEVALRSAVAQDRLHLAYQPIVELATGRVAGAEALLRWNDPQRGAIPPAVFVPIAEDSNLISTIGGWVLRRAVGQLAAWREAGVVAGDFAMSVNVSARQLTDPGLPELLADELRRARVPAGCLVLEITESVMVEGSAGTDQILRELRGLGVRLSVDDFGTGYSALGYLRRHPVTGVKIDRSFVAGLGFSAEDEEIVRAVSAMSTALGLGVVAEGVETAVQRDVLAVLGVPLGQGWLWGRAVEPAEFARRWAHRSAPVPG